MSVETGIPLAIVCRITATAHSTVYGRGRAVERVPWRRESQTIPSDVDLSSLIRQVISEDFFWMHPR